MKTKILKAASTLLGELTMVRMGSGCSERLPNVKKLRQLKEIENMKVAAKLCLVRAYGSFLCRSFSFF